MTILVTGGAGFIGSNFIHYWLKHYKEDFIINLDALTYASNLNNLKEIEKHSCYTFLKGNICDEYAINDVIKWVDVVINFAATTHVDNSIKDSSEFIKTNIEGVRVLLDACRKNSVRFHQVSTDEVYGSLGFNEKRFNEQTPYNPLNPYSASKAAADHLVRAYYNTYKMPVTISNCSNNYGPRQYTEKLIPHFINLLKENKNVPVYGNGKNVRDWLYVEDHCRALDLIIRKGKMGETYCIGGGNEISNLELTKKIIQLMEKSEDKISFVKDRPGHDLRYSINYDKIKRELGWKPKVNFEQGLKETIKWYLIN